MFEVNWVGVLVAAVASMALGFLWYSPTLFGQQWSKLMGYTKESLEKAKKGMGALYALSTVGALVMAYVLAQVLTLAGSVTLLGSLKTAFGVWLGFVAPVQMTDVLFGSKKWNLYYINTGYQLASLLVMALVLTLLG